MKEDVEDLTEMVLRIAQTIPQTRDSYPILVIQVWLEQKIMFTSKKGGYFIPYKHIKEITSTESITRTYRKLCEDHPEIRPSEKVKEYREQNEFEMRCIGQWFPTLNGVKSKQTSLLVE
jgi:hypothetical protein